MKRIAVLMPSGIGDFVRLAPELLQIRRRYRDAEIQVFADGTKPVGQVCEMMAPIVDGFVDLRVRRWTVAGLILWLLVRAPGFLAEYGRWYDRAIVLSPTRFRLVLAKALAPVSVGYNPPPATSWRGCFDLPAVERDPNMVVIHPYGVTEARTWPEARWHQVLDYLIGQGYRVHLVGHSMRPLPGVSSGPLWSRAVNHTNGTRIRDLFQLTARAGLMITVDSGPMHIAVAVGTPCIGLFGLAYPDAIIHPDTPSFWRIYLPTPDAKPVATTRERTFGRLQEIEPPAVIAAIREWERSR